MTFPNTGPGGARLTCQAAQGHDACVAGDQWAAWWQSEGEAGLRRLLMESWDPIGVADTPEAAGEYDSYIPVVGAKLRAGDAVDEIAAYLSFVRTQLMGLPANPGADRTAAERASEWHGAALG